MTANRGIPFDMIRSMVDGGTCPTDPLWLHQATETVAEERARQLQLAQQTKRPRIREEASAAARDAHRIHTALRAMTS